MFYLIVMRIYIILCYAYFLIDTLQYNHNIELICYYLFCRVTGIYLRIIWRVIKSDIIKFSVLYGIFLFVFVGSFYFGLRSGVTVKDDGQLVSDVSVFPLETL